MAKQEVYDRIHVALGLATRPLSDGGTPHAEVIAAIALARGLPVRRDANKVQLARRIVEAAGKPWVPGVHDSTTSASGGGGNITGAGLEALLQVLEAPVGVSSPDPSLQAVIEGLALTDVASDELDLPCDPAPMVERPPGVDRKRNPHVVAAVLRRANGCCEACGEESPFAVMVAGQERPFLEVHHVRPLSQDGSDRPQNAVAVCPNCHRALHLAVDRVARIEELYRAVPRLERED